MGIAQHRTVARFDTADWQPLEMQGLPNEQVWWANVSFDEGSGRGSYLMKMAPGTRTNAHIHHGVEEFFVAEGDLVDHDGHTYRAGDFVSLASGSNHNSHSPSGCLIVVTHRGQIEYIEEPRP